MANSNFTLSTRERPMTAGRSDFTWTGNVGSIEASTLGLPPGVPPEAIELTSHRTGVTKTFYLFHVTDNYFRLATRDGCFQLVILNT